MKKSILAMALMLTIGMTSAFAKSNEGVDQSVIASFQKEFVTATNVVWEQQKDYTRAMFTMNNQVMYAYYDQKGEFLAVIRNILSDQLPINLLSDLKKNYGSYWISELFEISTDGATNYYITLQDADYTIVLKSEGSGEWTVFSKTKKNIA